VGYKMPTNTTKFNLVKPLKSEKYNVDVFNGNADIIDSQIYSKTEVDTSLWNKVDKLFATNLVQNGDFSNGTTGWTNNNSTLSVASNTLSIIGNGSSNLVRANQPNIFANNQVYYVRMRARVTNALATEMFIGHGNQFINIILTPIQNQWYEITGVISNPANTELRIYHNYDNTTNANGAVMEVQYVLAINLTQTFGAGNEPTKEQMDYLLSNFPNSWFNGTQELVNYVQLLNLVNTKANRVQEAWITPTLLNGWENNLTYGGIKYFKDSFGIVHITGFITRLINTGNGTVFELPVGYRPENNFLVFQGTNGIASGSASSSYIQKSNGNFYVYSNSLNYTVNISYKAGV
jgi:hypothetical protein